MKVPILQVDRCEPIEWTDAFLCQHPEQEIVKDPFHTAQVRDWT